jgi:hypothetical protein
MCVLVHYMKPRARERGDPADHVDSWEPIFFCDWPCIEGPSLMFWSSRPIEDHGTPGLALASVRWLWGKAILFKEW